MITFHAGSNYLLLLTNIDFTDSSWTASSFGPIDHQDVCAKQVVVTY